MLVSPYVTTRRVGSIRLLAYATYATYFSVVGLCHLKLVKLDISRTVRDPGRDRILPQLREKKPEGADRESEGNRLHLPCRGLKVP